MPKTLQSVRLAQKALLVKLARGERRSALQAGFTLIELLIVVIIIGILAAIALPAFLNQQDRARVNAAQDSVMNAARGCAALQITGENASFAKVPQTNATTGGTTDCPPSGNNGADKNYVSALDGMDAQATATLSTTGSVQLTGCANKGSWTPILTKDCIAE